MDGIARLREVRGEERVSFDGVAGHDHENDPQRGLVGTPELDVPTVSG